MADSAAGPTETPGSAAPDSPRAPQDEEKEKEEEHRPGPGGAASGNGDPADFSWKRRHSQVSSWRRSSLQGGAKRRKSLPPLHRDVADLSKSISLELPECSRLSSLLLASFQFSVEKLEHILRQTEGFSPDTFASNAQSVREELQQLLQQLERDGTLRNCVEDPAGNSQDLSLDESVAQVKLHISRFSAEREAWERLLQQHRDRAHEASRRLECLRTESEPLPPPPNIPSSQSSVLASKPDYSRILQEQGPVLRSMELLLEELLGAGRWLQALERHSRNLLRETSHTLASRTFRQLEDSPARRLLEG